jgi:GntR family transcriptional repressor for pyruvate dehydrogenase complex
MTTRRRSPSTEQVIGHVRDLIGRGDLKAGDKLPPERNLVAQLGVSRPTVRAALRALSAMGVIDARHGSGTYIRGGPPKLDTQALSFLAAIHGFTRDEIFEARRVLEVSAAGMAAERATGNDLAAVAEEVASLFASMDDPELFLVHDMQFHRAIAMACGNPIVASLIELVSTLFLEHRRPTAARASDRNLRDAADMHRRIYMAIRKRDADLARTLMNDHLRQAAMHHADEALEAVHRGRARQQRGLSNSARGL